LLKNLFRQRLTFLRFAANRFVRQQQRNEIMKQFFVRVKDFFEIFNAIYSPSP
jgi:hypothetical protein